MAMITHQTIMWNIGRGNQVIVWVGLTRAGVLLGPRFCGKKPRQKRVPDYSLKCDKCGVEAFAISKGSFRDDSWVNAAIDPRQHALLDWALNTRLNIALPETVKRSRKSGFWFAVSTNRLQIANRCGRSPFRNFCLLNNNTYGWNLMSHFTMCWSVRWLKPKPFVG